MGIKVTQSVERKRGLKMKDIIELIEEYGRACADVEAISYMRPRSNAHEKDIRGRPEQVLNVIRAKLWSRGCDRWEQIDAIGLLGAFSAACRRGV